MLAWLGTWMSSYGPERQSTHDTISMFTLCRVEQNSPGGFVNKTGFGGIESYHPINEFCVNGYAK